MKDKRPRNLNLFTIRLPVPALVSILHRISGLVLFLLVPFFLWLLNNSLSSQQTFDQLQATLTTPWARLIIWAALAAFIYHFIAGIRHLLMDIHLGEGLQSGRVSAIVTLILSIVLMAIAGAWLW